MVNFTEDEILGMISKKRKIHVMSAIALCATEDGALALVDSMSGVCVQTETVFELRQAIEERIMPVLLINKINRALLKCELEPEDLYQTLQRIVKSVIIIIGNTTNNDDASPMGGIRLLSNVFLVFDVIMNYRKEERASLLTKLNIELKPDDKDKDDKQLLKVVVKTWLWLCAQEALLQMIVVHLSDLSSPVVAQKYRMGIFYNRLPDGNDEYESGLEIKTYITQAPLMIHIFKMVPNSYKGRFYALTLSRVFSVFSDIVANTNTNSINAMIVKPHHFVHRMNKGVAEKAIDKTISMMDHYTEAIDDYDLSCEKTVGMGRGRKRKAAKVKRVFPRIEEESQIEEDVQPEEVELVDQIEDEQDEEEENEGEEEDQELQDKKTPATTKKPPRKSAPSASAEYTENDIKRIKLEQGDPTCPFCGVEFPTPGTLSEHIHLECNGLPSTNFLISKNSKLKKFSDLSARTYDSRRVTVTAMEGFLNSLPLKEDEIILPYDIVMFYNNNYHHPLRITNSRPFDTTPPYPEYNDHLELIKVVQTRIKEGTLNTVIIPVTFFTDETQANSLNKEYWQNKEHASLLVIRRVDTNSPFEGAYYDSYEGSNIFTKHIYSTYLRLFLKRMFGGRHIPIAKPIICHSLSYNACAAVVCYLAWTLVMLGDVVLPRSYGTIRGLKKRLLDALRRGK